MYQKIASGKQKCEVGQAECRVLVWSAEWLWYGIVQ